MRGLARCSHLQPCVEQLPARQKEKHTPEEGVLSLSTAFALGPWRSFPVLGTAAILRLLPLAARPLSSHGRGVSATSMVGKKGFAVAVLPVELHPSP